VRLREKSNKPRRRRDVPGQCYRRLGNRRRHHCPELEHRELEQHCWLIASTLTRQCVECRALRQPNTHKHQSVATSGGPYGVIVFTHFRSLAPVSLFGFIMFILVSIQFANIVGPGRGPQALWTSFLLISYFRKFPKALSICSRSYFNVTQTPVTILPIHLQSQIFMLSPN